MQVHTQTPSLILVYTPPNTKPKVSFVYYTLFKRFGYTVMATNKA